MGDVAIPCKNCGGELYDSVRKYHLDVPCENNPCYDFKGGHWTKGSYCPWCNATIHDGGEAERKMLGFE